MTRKARLLIPIVWIGVAAVWLSLGAVVSPTALAAIPATEAAGDPVPQPAQNEQGAKGGGATATPCAVSGKLVNECRPWFGARATGYPQTGGALTSQYSYLEQRVGRSLDVAHTFNAAGTVPFTEETPFLQTRPNLIMYVNWKPDDNWPKARGGDATVDARINQAAANIKAIAPRKIFLTLFHEPENDVSPGTSSCPGLKGTAGSPADYRAMWQNVRTMFDAQGVTNVVWVMNYMNYSAWDCLVSELWPGNLLVDWVGFEAYGSTANLTWQKKVGHFYSLLEQNSTPAHDYASKPWAVAEFSFKGGTQSQAYAYYDSIRQAVAANTYPRLKMYNVFDSPGGENDGSLRVGYGANGAYDTREQQRFNAVANLPVFLTTTKP